MTNQKGSAHLLLLLLLIVAGTVTYFLYTRGIIKNPLANTPLSKIINISNKPEVKLQSDYKNPFDKDVQYVNPFASYKNPFDGLKKGSSK